MARMTPLETAQRYVDLVDAQDFAAIPVLFAPDALWRPAPPQPEVQGAAAIDAGYRALAERETPAMRVVDRRFYVDGNTVVAEFGVDTDGVGVSEVVDVFTFDAAGLIVRMSAYSRPTS